MSASPSSSPVSLVSPTSPTSPEDDKKGCVPIHETPQHPDPPMRRRTRHFPLDWTKLDSDDESTEELRRELTKWNLFPEK